LRSWHFPKVSICSDTRCSTSQRSFALPRGIYHCRRSYMQIQSERAPLDLRRKGFLRPAFVSTFSLIHDATFSNKTASIADDSYTQKRLRAPTPGFQHYYSICSLRWSSYKALHFFYLKSFSRRVSIFDHLFCNLGISADHFWGDGDGF
jgi:hypothetical protein